MYVCHIEQDDEGTSSSLSLVFGYKIVGDNIDKNVRPRYTRQHSKTLSMHCYHSYAVRDRVNISGLSDEVPNLQRVPLLSVPVTDILPSQTDEISIKHNFAILVSRQLVEHMKHFKENYSDVVQKHLVHDYYEEMSQKSEIVRIIIVQCDI